jgi:hypothetical protein
VAARHGVATPCALPRIPFRRNVIALASVLCLQFLFAGLLYWLVEWQGIWVGGV